MPYTYERNWAIWPMQVLKQVAGLSQRDRATHELLQFAKWQSGIFEPPFLGGLRGNVDASCVRR